MLAIAACMAAVMLGDSRGPSVTSVAGAAVPETSNRVGDGSEVAQLRTRNSRVVRSHDGSLVQQVYPGPVNFREAGSSVWKPIENTLVRGRDGFRNQANSYGVELPEDLADPVRVNEGDHTVGFRLRGARGAAEVTANRALYRDALPGVDVRYATHNDAVKEELIIKDASAATTFRFDLLLAPGYTARQSGQTVSVLDTEGRRVGGFLPPMMYAGPERAREYSDAVSLQVERADPGWSLVLSADAAWVKARVAKGPVVVDPTWHFNADTDCQIVSGADANTNFCGDVEIKAGRGSAQSYRSLLFFDFAQSLRNRMDILSAHLTLNVEWNSTSSTAMYDVHELTRDFTSSVTWNDHDGSNPWNQAGGDFEATEAASLQLGNSTGEKRWNITDLVEKWRVNDPDGANHGLVLKQRSESVANIVSFASSRYGNSDKWPRLDIRFYQTAGVMPGYNFEPGDRLTDRLSMHVNTGSRNVLLQERLFSIPGTGMPLEITRSYNSIFANGTMGHTMTGDGWQMDFGFDVGLEELDDESVAFWGPTGIVKRYRKNSDGSFRTPAGVNAKLVKETDGSFTLTWDRSKLKWIFTSTGRLVRKEDRNGNEITYTWAGADRVTTITDTQGRDTTLTYDNDNFVTEIEDPAGRTVTFGYTAGATGKVLTTVTDPDNKTTTYGYGAFNELTSITTPEGRTTTLTHSFTRVTSVTRDQDTTYYGDVTGSSPCPQSSFGVSKSTDPRNNETFYCYDAQDRVDRVYDAKGHVRSRSYNANSNVEVFTTESGAETSASYDTTNRLTSVTQPAETGNQGAATSFDYTGRGDDFGPASMTDPQGNETSYSYTTKGNLSGVQESTSSAPQVEIDYNDGEGSEPDNGTIKSSTDGNGNETTYEYDSNGNLEQVDYPNGSGLGSTEITYTTSVSRVATLTDGRGNRKEFTYDPLDRVVEIDVYRPNSTLYTTLTYDYDADGNLLSRTDPTGTTTYTYDDRGRRDSQTLPGRGTTTYGYDSVSNLTGIHHAGEAIVYAYDEVNLPIEVWEPGASTPTYFEYDDDDRRTKTTYPNGVVQIVDYDKAGRIQDIRATHGTDVLTDFEYDYQDGTAEQDLRSEMRDLRRNTTTTYTYDALNRLTEADTSGSLSDVWSYTYDNASNRLTRTHNTNTVHYKYDQGNQLCWSTTGTTSSNCTPAPSGATSFTHDAHGNMTGNSSGLTIDYNPLNQTEQFTPASGPASTFTYADQGQTERVSKTTSSSTTTFSDTLLGTSSDVTGSSTRHWLRDVGGQLVARRDGNSSEYYLTDALGSVAALTDNNGDVSRRYVYNDPYGEDITSTGTTNDPWRFVGGYFDTETDLYKFGERYYRPTLGRWTQRDPLNQVLDSVQANRYAYVGDNPVNYVDLTGLERCADYGYTVGGLRFCRKPLSDVERDAGFCLGAGAVAFAFKGGPWGAAGATAGCAYAKIFE